MISHGPRLGPSYLVLALLGLGSGCNTGEGGDGLGGMGGLGGTPPAACDAAGGVFAEAATDHEFGPGQDVGQEDFPALVLGAPRGAGATAGSTDHVVSLGDGGFVAVAFGEHAIVDGAGVDFLVFENPFFVGGDLENPYAELGRVSVSQDGEHWVSFPCTAEEYPYGTCAGWHPVLANQEDNDLDATDPEVAGGDPFDLQDVGLDWARYVRIDDVVDDQELAFDLDAVSVVHPGCF